MNIKNYIYITMAFPLMLLALVGCSKDDDDTSDTRMPISFSGLGSEEITRAGEVSLSEYITDFTVYGINGMVNDAESFSQKSVVFPDYQVWYTANSANTTSSNSSNWEYVGKNQKGEEQTIKYWDEKTNCHYFWAVGNASKYINKVVDANGNGLVDKLSVGITNDDVKDRKKSLYYSDPKCVGNADYNKPVQLTFHDFASKIRVGFYESVEQPSQTENSGKLYKVTGLQFFGINDGSFSDDASENVCLKGDFVEEGTVDITYDYTKMVANASVTSSKINKVESFGTLSSEVSVDHPLTTSSANALFATNGGEQYTYVIPYNNTKGLTIKCNVKVESDSDWQPLYATVPATYTNWQPNHSYTYIFKIVSAKDQTIIMLDDVLIDNWHKGGSQDEDEWRNW